MCIDVESTAEADGDGRHLAATCQPMEKNYTLRGGEERAAEGLNSSRRTGGGFGVAQIAGGREAGERGRARERERERPNPLPPSQLSKSTASGAHTLTWTAN